MKKLNNQVGRPKKININDQTKEKILNLIFYYHSNYNPYPEIRYKNIWEYFKELYKSGDFEYETSYDFWKRLGREGRDLVDKVNTHLNSNKLISNTKNIDMINFKELIEKYGSHNKEILWENIKPYEKHLTQLTLTIDKIQKENHKITEHNEYLKLQLKESKKLVDNLQNLLFSLFAYSNKDNELYNLLNSGQSKSKVINLALEETFENPMAFFNEMVSKSFNTPLPLADVNQKNNLYEFTPNHKNEKEYDL